MARGKTPNSLKSISANLGFEAKLWLAAEDPHEYRPENIFWVPSAARWTCLQNSSKQPTIGKIVYDTMVAIERDNPSLKGILPLPEPHA